MAMVKRILPLRPRRLGTRRRPRGTSGGSRVVGVCAPAKRAASLDSFIHLATSIDDELKTIHNRAHRQRKAEYFQGVLIDSLYRLTFQLNEETRKYSNEDVTSRKTRRQWHPQRDAERLSNCQKEWIGFRSTCCDGKAVAVPVGCNHRLCFLCNSHRAEHYRERVRNLFDRLHTPQFLTLTVPNVTKIRKGTYGWLRKSLKRFIYENRAYLRGGVYSIETTFNRQTKTWHPHVHILIDAAAALPKGDREAFIRLKRKLEFSWLRHTWLKKYGLAWKAEDFDFWFANTTTQQRGEWNAINRRVVDIRPVRDREKAAYEILKYISKPAKFADLPEALAEFLMAVRGVRVIQTFGTWYGFKLDEPATPEGHLRVEKYLKCGCGKNEFKSIGRLTFDHVDRDAEGKYFVKAIVVDRLLGRGGTG